MNKIGQFEEYYVGLKFIGKRECAEQPDRTLGYAGKQKETATTEMKFGRKKIKAGQEYTTIYYEMQGKHSPEAHA